MSGSLKCPGPENGAHREPVNPFSPMLSIAVYDISGCPPSICILGIICRSVERRAVGKTEDQVPAWLTLMHLTSL